MIPFIFWILTLPFVTFGHIYEGAKIFVFWVGSFLLILYWLIKKRAEFIKVLNKWDVWYWIWILLLVTSSIFGIDPMKSIIGGGYRHQGVIFFIALWLVGKSFHLISKKSKIIFNNYFIIAVILQCLLVISQKLFNFDLTNGRPMGTFGEANAVSGFINLGLFFSQNMYFVILIFFSNLVLQSRTGIIMFLILITPLLFKSKKIFILLIMLSLIIVIGFSLDRKNSSQFKFEDRGVFNKIAFSAISKRPIFGYGLESGDIVFEQEFKKIGINLEDLMIDRSHNLFLDILIWSGILGLIPFCIWLFGNLVEFYRARELKKSIAIIGILFFGILQPLWLVHWIMLFLILNW